MQADLREALSARYPDNGDAPAWIPPFLCAVDQLDQLYEREEGRPARVARQQAAVTHTERWGYKLEEHYDLEADQAGDEVYLKKAETDLLLVSPSAAC